MINFLSLTAPCGGVVEHGGGSSQRRRGGSSCEDRKAADPPLHTELTARSFFCCQPCLPIDSSWICRAIETLSSAWRGRHLLEKFRVGCGARRSSGNERRIKVARAVPGSRKGCIHASSRRVRTSLTGKSFYVDEHNMQPVRRTGSSGHFQRYSP